MTTINYPSSIRPVLLNGFSRNQDAKFMSTESRSGKTYFKRIAQNQNTYANVAFKFTQQESVIFQSWFINTLQMGFLPFNLELCTEWGKVNYECRFIPDSLLPATKDTPLWSYTATILIYNYGPPSYIPPDIAEFPDYFTEDARNWLDIIVNTQLNKV